jgi:hypothetical protein
MSELLMRDCHGRTSFNEQTGMQVAERFQTATRYAEPVENWPKDSLNYVVGAERCSLLGCEIVRKLRLNPRGPVLRKSGIRGERYWWERQNEDQS